MTRLDKPKILKKLAVEIPEKLDMGDIIMEQLSLAKSLLKIAEINPENEYELCKRTARKILGETPELEEIDIDI